MVFFAFEKYFVEQRGNKRTLAVCKIDKNGLRYRYASDFGKTNRTGMSYGQSQLLFQYNYGGKMKDTLTDLYNVVLSRKNEKAEGSYTCYLFEKGLDKILKKVGEECSETIIAAKNAEQPNSGAEKKSELVGEICDLYYHITVMMAALGVTPDDVNAELEKRSLKTGNLKSFHSTDKNT